METAESIPSNQAIELRSLAFNYFDLKAYVFKGVVYDLHSHNVHPWISSEVACVFAKLTNVKKRERRKKYTSGGYTLKSKVHRYRVICATRALHRRMVA